ncbi:MAG: alpha/beta fold hydrolase [Chloroflexi bacterium]|nr:MAG: alpha/beta fold hydrolase [Chloroflexota bacterium]
MQLAVCDFGGSGAGIILLHGLGRSLLDWQLIAPLLTGDHHVVAIDLRCHGRSGDGSWSWEDSLGDVGVVAAHLRLVNPSIAGHSLGGMLAVMWGAGHPDCPGVVNLDGHGKKRPDQYPPGVGKTHLAVALGMEAVANGHNVYFITVPELLDELARDVQENRLGERLVKLRVPTLLILDEIGYRPWTRWRRASCLSLSPSATPEAASSSPRTSPTPSGALSSVTRLPPLPSSTVCSTTRSRSTSAVRATDSRTRSVPASSACSLAPWSRQRLRWGI